MLELLRNAGGLQNSLRYNYEEISQEHRETVKEAAIDIRQRTKRASDDILQIGARLCEVKALLPHGQFTDWVKEEFDLSGRTAQNLMNVAQRFLDKSETVSLLGTSVLYLLAAPTTPDAAVDAVVEYAQANGAPTKAETQRIIAEHKELRYLNDTEAESAVWRAIQAQRYRLGSDMLAWMATATPDDYRKPLNPGVVLEDDTLAKALAKVRGDIQRMAEKETPPPPAKPARAVYVEPVAPPPPAVEILSVTPIYGEIVEDDEDESDALPPSANRNARLRYILAAYKEALRLVPEYGDLTGYHSQGLQIKRRLEDAIRNLQGNLVE